MKKIHAAALFIILSVSGYNAAGQAVKISCTEVLPDGDVLISWDTLNLGSTFSSYKVYSSSHRAGPFTLLATITDMGQGDYSHFGAGANSDTVFYYLLTDLGGGNTIVTDTLATMLLAANIIVDFEVVDFIWTPLHEPSPFLAEMYPKYFLYREYPVGSWAIVDSTVNLALNYYFWDCNANNDTVRFKIGVRNDSNGCISYSNQKKAILKNVNNLYPPVIDSVSITAGGEVIIGWQPCEEPDIQGYFIYTVSSGNDSLDYVDGRLTTSYLHKFSKPCDGALRYIVTSIDSCGNESPFPYDTVTAYDKPHSTIYLQDIQYDPCLMTNQLAWNEYINFDPPLGYTNIYASENGGNYNLVGTVPPGQAVFTHSDLLPNTGYSYFVRAYSQDGLKSSTSCSKDVETYNSPRPMFMYTRYVTVEDNERAILFFYTDTNAHVQLYRILRSIDTGGPYEEVGVIQNEGQEFISFSDEGAEVTAQSYYYKIEVVDSCGITSEIANTVRTIFLESEALPDFNNGLSWNTYESWEGRTLGYRIYRRLDNGSPDLLADVDSLTLTFTDNVSSLTGSISKISYFVEAYEGTSNNYGFSEISYSNEVLSEQEPQVYLPNAFAPRGLNNMLKPVFVFVGNEGYEFLVYNRWGQLIFQTSDPGDGWDGKYNGDYVQQDVYVYLVKFFNAVNQPVFVKGNVAVIF